MKKFKVKETFLVTSWSYVEANSIEEAEVLLQSGEDPYMEQIVDERHEETLWDTLQEI